MRPFSTLALLALATGLFGCAANKQPKPGSAAVTGPIRIELDPKDPS